MGKLQNLISQEVWQTLEALLLVFEGEDANTQNLEGQSLIHLLVTYDAYGIQAHNRFAIARLVRHHNGDIEGKNRQNKTPLQSLLEQEFNAEDALFLVGLGANPNTVNDKGETLLQLLIKSPSDNAVAIKELLEEYRANVTLQNQAGETALDVLLKTIKTRETSAENALAFISHCSDFVNYITGLVRNGDMTELSSFTIAAYILNKNNFSAIESKVKEIAFSALMNITHELSPIAKREKLIWAKEQPIFWGWNYSPAFIAGNEKENRTAVLDKMIAATEENQNELFI